MGYLFYKPKGASITRAEKMKSKPNIIIVDDDKRVLKKLAKLLYNKTKKKEKK